MNGKHEAPEPLLDPAHAEFERRVAALLVDSADSLDGRTRSALTQVRHAALQAAARAPTRVRASGWLTWAPAGALAMALLVIVFYGGQRPGALPGYGAVAPSAVASNGGGLDDLALVTDADAYDLSEDGDLDLDADFYEWAAAAGGVAGDGLQG
jgi:hypothetical protein